MALETLNFIKSSIRREKILWTYHVNMRMKGRFISRKTILGSLETYEIIESYPDDKYLPSYLIYAEYKGEVFHFQIATDFENDMVRIITAYKPSLLKWNEDLKTRRES